MRVAELWRFPVKSLQGEQLDDAAVDDGGIVGDRAYALFDLEIIGALIVQSGTMQVGDAVAR